MSDDNPPHCNRSLMHAPWNALAICESEDLSRLLAVLDEMDGNPDLEPDEGQEQDDADLEGVQ